MNFTLISRIAALGALLVAVSTVRAGDNDCTIATKDDNQVSAACKAGGIKRAKAVMKAMTKVAKQKAMKVDCDSCHKNDTDYALTSDAKEQFKKMLELVK